MFWVLFLLLLKTVIYDMTTRKWLLFSANSTIFQLYHGENKLIFNEMMMRSAELDLYSASSLKQQSMGRHQGRIQDFVLGGVHLKKLRRAEGGAKIFGVFRVKNHDFTPKNHIYFNFRGARAGCAPPGSTPGREICHIKRKRTKWWTVVYKKLHRKLKIEQHESHLKPDGTLSVTTWVFSFTLYVSFRFCTMISQSDCTKYLNATKICRK
jgi:hypothetical protein